MSLDRGKVSVLVGHLIVAEVLKDAGAKLAQSAAVAAKAHKDKAAVLEEAVDRLERERARVTAKVVDDDDQVLVELADFWFLQNSRGLDK